MKNTVTRLSFICNTQEVRTAQSGKATSSLSFAATRRFKDTEGNRQTETEWHRITCFNAVGKCVTEHVAKGAMIMVKGRIHYMKWFDAEGRTRHSCEIVAEQVDFLAKAKEATKEEPKMRRSK
jgi:single-strand DNA-binding protein